MNAQSLMAHGVRMLLPFAERIAIRAMVLAAISGSVLVGLFVTLLITVNTPLVVVTAGVATLFVTSLITFLSLFARFDQGRG